VSRQRILFVDDEPPVLAAMENVLRRHRSRWDVTFAAGGSAALRCLADEAFDVVISDLHMPEVDGVAVLARARELQPAAGRVVLSGHVDLDAVIRTLPVAQQFLTKPCPPDELRVAIERGCALRDLVPDEGLRAEIARLQCPTTAVGTERELLDFIADPRHTLEDLVRGIERDPALAVRVLRLANSPLVAPRQPVLSVHGAVAALGADLRLGERESRAADHAEESLAGGLILGFGRWAQAEVGRSDLELTLLGVTHAEIGAYLLGVWGLPLRWIEGVIGSGLRSDRLQEWTHLAEDELRGAAP
jgi:CheY-like chemotaxis protein